MCAENGVFLLTFPIPQMSQEDLERAATAPSVWLARFMQRKTLLSENEFENEVFPSMERSLALEDATLNEYNRLFIVPGGRFLITFQTNQCCLWDLGYSFHDAKLSHNQPSATLPLSFCLGQVVKETPDKLGIRIVLNELKESNMFGA